MHLRTSLYVHAATIPCLVVTKISVQLLSLNFVICIGHMPPCWLCLLNVLLVQCIIIIMQI